MDKKAGHEIEELLSKVAPDGFAVPAAGKRPGASSCATNKRAKVDPSSVDTKQLAQTGGVRICRAACADKPCSCKATLSADDFYLSLV